jgi:MFS family permease
MAASPREPVSLRVQGTIYGAGLVYFGVAWMAGLIIPLYLVQIGAPSYVIGIVIGSRAALTLLLSIHGGALMDRLGTRRVMIAFAVISMVAPLLFPLTSWIPALIALQMIAGLADAMGWIGAQALSGTLMQGNPTYVGRMTLAARFASFVSPLLVGAIWDNVGIWGAFITMSLWSMVGLFAVLALPVTDHEGTTLPGTRVRPGDLMPRVADYVAAFRLCSVPAIALVLFVTMLRVGGTGIQNSFYVVYLNTIDIDGAKIGLLLGVVNLCASAGVLAVGPAARMIHPHWLVVLTVTLTILTVASTPLLFGIYGVLLVVIGFRGLCLGISQPLEISILGRSLGADSQGKGVGLRTTANRSASMIVPMIMGVVADLAGIENSFLIMGGVLLAFMGLTAFHVYRHPGLAQENQAKDGA